MTSTLDRDQLIAEMIAGRSASAQRYSNGQEIDFRTGQPGANGRHSTDFQDMARQHASTAAIREWAEECADRIMEQDEESLALYAPPRSPGRPAGGETVSVHLLLPPALRDALDAQRGDVSRLAFIRRILNEWVAAHSRKSDPR